MMNVKAIRHESLPGKSSKEEATDTVDASGSTLVVTDTLQIASGKFTSASTFKNVVFSLLGTLELSGNITVSGEWQNWFGTLEHNNHTVVLNGTDQSIGGSTTFHNLTKEVAQADTLEFMTGFGTTIEGSLTLRGSPGQLLSLRGDDPESQWEINPQGARNIAYVDVLVSRNIHETPINAGIGSVNSGNNEGWFFQPLQTYTVSYNGNGETSGTAPDNQTKIQGQNLTLASNTGNLAKTGFAFAGWNTQADGSGTNYAEGATYAADAALALYAKWSAEPAPDAIPTLSQWGVIILAGLLLVLGAAVLRGNKMGRSWATT